jgi:energy-coupling factor transporter ATP-binding protein EcfA2
MEEKKFKLVFTDTDIDNIEDDEIILLSPWRSEIDPGYKFSCRCMVKNPNMNNEVDSILSEGLIPNMDSVILFESFIGFLPPENPDEYELDFFKKHIDSFPNIMDLIQYYNENNCIERLRFFTMLPSMAEYRKVVEKLGSTLLNQVLEATNDLVFNKDKQPSWFDEAVKSKVFKLGLMRHSETFFTFYNAGHLLGGLDSEMFDGISQNLTLKYSLDGFENNHVIKLKYASSGYIPKRINVLIGKNGVGKSQALKAFCRAALRYDDESISLSDNTTNGRPMINRLLAIATPGEIQTTFPGERRRTQKLYYRRLSLTRNGRAKPTESIADQLVQLAREDEKIGSYSRWNLFNLAIEKIAPLDSIVVKLLDGSYVSLNEFRHTNKRNSNIDLWANLDTKQEPKLRNFHTPHPMSSGQLIFFKFALMCCLYIENGSFVLLDEPETHMHPNMISDFIELLDTLLEETGSQGLIATHSAYFVREVSREQVHILSKESSAESTDENNQLIAINHPRLRTFGADVESISQFVFSEDIESRLTDKIYKRIKNQSFESVEKELSEELSLAALMELQSRLEVSTSEKD